MKSALGQGSGVSLKESCVWVFFLVVWYRLFFVWWGFFWIGKSNQVGLVILCPALQTVSSTHGT